MTKKLCFSAFTLASPRLMEPYYECEITTPFDCVRLIANILKNRRSTFLHDLGNPGTFYHIISTMVPIIESFGLEVDLRFHTQVIIKLYRDRHLFNFFFLNGKS